MCSFVRAGRRLWIQAVYDGARVDGNERAADIRSRGLQHLTSCSARFLLEAT